MKLNYSERFKLTEIVKKIYILVRNFYNAVLFKKTISTILVIILISSCSTLEKMPYYENNAVAENILRIQFTSNKYYSRDLTIKLIYGEAAKVALDNGYKFFYILDTKNINDNLNENSAEIENKIIANEYDLIGCYSEESINYSLPYYMIDEDQKNLTIYILLVNEKIDELLFPFDAQKIIRESTVVEYFSRRSAERQIPEEIIEHPSVKVSGVILTVGVIALMVGGIYLLFKLGTDILGTAAELD